MCEENHSKQDTENYVEHAWHKDDIHSRAQVRFDEGKRSNDKMGKITYCHRPVINSTN